jgi:hypothetical protein
MSAGFPGLQRPPPPLKSRRMFRATIKAITTKTTAFGGALAGARTV